MWVESLQEISGALALALGVLFVVAVAAFALWQRARRQQAQLQQENYRLAMEMAVFEEKLTRVDELKQGHRAAQEKIDELQERLQQSQQERLQAEHRNSELKLQLDLQQQQSEEKLVLLQEAKNQLKLEFENLSHRIFEQKGKTFADQSQASLNHMLNPLRDQLKEFKQRVENVYEKESKDRTLLYNEILQLKQLNERISEDALNLTKALKGDSKTQGNWGEMILERVLEQSGLQKGREYFTQNTYQSEGGRVLRPDVVVRLPEKKDVVIDAKVSLTAYERFCAAPDEAEAERHLKEHVQSIRGHVNGLAGKDYAHLEALRSLDFVLLFIPIEAAFVKAVETDPDLFSQAFEKNIMIVCPSTLLVTLRTIQNIWRYEYQNQNAQKIADQAGGIHDQLALVLESLQDMGDKLDKSQQAYAQLTRRFSDGRGNLIRRVDQLREMGAKTKRALPQAMREQSQSSPKHTEDDIQEEWADEPVSN